MNIIDAVKNLRDGKCKAIYSKSSITEYIGLGFITPDINYSKLVNTRDGRCFEFDICDITYDDWECSQFGTYEEYYNSI